MAKVSVALVLALFSIAVTARPQFFPPNNFFGNFPGNPNMPNMPQVPNFPNMPRFPNNMPQMPHFPQFGNGNVASSGIQWQGNGFRVHSNLGGDEFVPAQPGNGIFTSSSSSSSSSNGKTENHTSNTIRDGNGKVIFHKSY